MAAKRKRKCRHCMELYEPDSRNIWHQRYCEKDECQGVRKKESNARWLRKKENRNYFSGPENVRRVQEWRAKNPKYWQRKGTKSRTALQDFDGGQPVETIGESGEFALQDFVDTKNGHNLLILLGLIAQISGTTLQDDINKSTRILLKLGQDIIAGKIAHDKQSSTGPGKSSPSP